MRNQTVLVLAFLPALAVVAGAVHTVARLMFVYMNVFQVPCTSSNWDTYCTYDSYGLLTGTKSFGAYTGDPSDIMLSHLFAAAAFILIAVILTASYGLAGWVADQHSSWRWEHGNKKLQRERAEANN